MELDTAEAARLWHAGIRAAPGTGGVVIGFTLPSRQAFWGARCAIVADPDGVTRSVGEARVHAA